ncbi:MlaA family lipoprotein [Desulfosudis oleivorans]|uniref:VacJ family lipoprotein n=1 Tax=Desulfosudis oleivorans (strain DSM 6200 / JCM 39069 / Hxd3) TaxID=96561 RepID=A8ZUZ4_DESOH|nr:VacJ family lipoprotein [Desulfosudis oleivorans]ABW68084.1 VacJ family lipoprotein [Desulfosudis oleivorans Hxd3]
MKKGDSGPGQAFIWTVLISAVMAFVLASPCYGVVDTVDLKLESSGFYLESPAAPGCDIDVEPDTGPVGEDGVDTPPAPLPSEDAAGDTVDTGTVDTDDDFGDFDEFDEFDAPEQPPVFDPLSGYNRVMTQVNDRLYYWVLKPMARGYKVVMPKPVRRGIGNAFENLGFPVRFANNALQGKVHSTGVETARFLINTTLGIGGLWDPAQQWMGVGPCDEDFGQTLGRYGLGGGFHVVLPVFGPSNVRDTVGRVADGFLNPVAYLEDADTSLAISAVRTINDTSLRLGQYEALTKDAVDLYILMRDGYEQYRRKKIEE